MRNQIARVILGASLAAVSAFAQAPASSLEASVEGFGQRLSQPAPERRAADDLRVPAFGSRALLASSRDYLQQDGTDYSLSSLFRQNHGEFMDRYQRFDPSLEVRGRLLPNQRINGEPGAFDMYGYDFDFEVPVLISTESYLKFGLYHYGRRYDTTGPFGTRNNPATNFAMVPLTESNFGNENLTAAGVRLGLGVFLDDNILLELETNPGAYSDLEGSMKSKDWDLPSHALVTVRTLDNFFLKFGARYNQIYEDAPWLPYLGFSWEIAEGLRFDLLAPDYVEVSWWPVASTSFSFGAMVTGAQYHVRGLGQFGKERTDVQVQEVISYVGLTHRFSDAVSLQARTGIVLAGDYDLATGSIGFDNTSGALDQGFYADLTFGINW